MHFLKKFKKKNVYFIFFETIIESEYLFSNFANHIVSHTRKLLMSDLQL